MRTWLRQPLASLVLLLGAVFVLQDEPAAAQIAGPGVPTQGDAVASLEDQLINRLRATEEQQRGYIRRVTLLVREGKLEPRLVVAVYRYAVRRQPVYPFPYFERAMRFEAQKRGIRLPPVQLVATTAGEARFLR